MYQVYCVSINDFILVPSKVLITIVIFKGADINLLDKERRSPLLLAASRGGWRTVHSLIRMGANIHLKDVNQRNVLHLVVMNGGRLEEFAEEVSKVSPGPK